MTGIPDRYDEWFGQWLFGVNLWCEGNLAARRKALKSDDKPSILGQIRAYIGKKWKHEENKNKEQVTTF